MAKQRKPPEHAPVEERTEAAAASFEVDPTIAEQGVLGNAVLAARLDGSSAEVGVSAASGREVCQHALPLARQAQVALLLPQRPTEEVARMLAIVEGSKLPDDRKEALIERLEEQHAASVEALAAWEATVGSLDEEARSLWADALGQAIAGLEGGREPGPGEGSVADRAARFVGELVAEARPELQAEAAAQVCRSVVLMVHFEEDEEEEEGFDYATEESGS